MLFITTSNAPIAMQKKTAILATALTLCSTQAFAARPLFTDVAPPQGIGSLLVEVGVESTRKDETINGVAYRRTDSTASVILSYGLSDKIDLIAEIPYQWYTGMRNNVITYENSSIGDMSLHAKWSIYDKENSWLTISLKPGIILPTGNVTKGLGNGKTGGEFVLIASRRAELLSTHINLGVTHNEYSLESIKATSNPNIWKASFANELNLIGNLKLVGDIGIETSKEKNAEKNHTYILGGAKLGIDRDTDVDVAIKKEMNTGDANSTNITLNAGLTMHY